MEIGPVHLWRWPEQAPAAVAELAREHGTVIGLALPPGLPRDACRQQARLAVTALVCQAWGCPAAALSLPSQAGQAARICGGGLQAHLSFSYAPGFAVAALRSGSAIGIDLVRTDQTDDWAAVAALYLSPAQRAAIEWQAPQQRTTSYAQAWAALEARHKVGGLPLSEYSPEREQQLERVSARTGQLYGLPDGYVGAICA